MPDTPFRFTADSIFWFNFFPAQPYLFEKTFAVWARRRNRRAPAAYF